jgi:hypothetical protein
MDFVLEVHISAGILYVLSLAALAGAMAWLYTRLGGRK